ncbi:amino acid racemase [Vibrio sp. Of14-4]|uniref:aspartate/glutamate racemase family protein n=1 Tax=Vibrio sp. Of14-4 TaxID=2724878 RepID=UPI001EF2C52E|nr:amino acid racemase [Vibrio sp. Of14-4]MCG7489508.1 amino acid racemase [Vibrio sp. Of14-4]
MGNSLKHIGIVGCSAEGAALCYKTICTESPKTLGQHVHPEISMHTHSLADYVDCLNSNDIIGIGELMLSSAQKLKNQGAEFLICPDNTIHQAFKYVEERSPLPWLHIAQVVVESAKHQDFRKLGILGTKWLVESNVYPEKIAAMGLAWERPSNEESDEIGRIIMAQLVYGIFKTESVTYFQKVIRRLKDKGCDAIILGCTEIPLIIDDSNSVLPTLDSNRLLAEAAIRLASEHTSV